MQKSLPTRLWGSQAVPAPRCPPRSSPTLPSHPPGWRRRAASWERKAGAWTFSVPAAKTETLQLGRTNPLLGCPAWEGGEKTAGEGQKQKTVQQHVALFLWISSYWSYQNTSFHHNIFFLFYSRPLALQWRRCFQHPLPTFPICFPSLFKSREIFPSTYPLPHFPLLLGTVSTRLGPLPIFQNI